MSPDPLSHIRTIHERFRCVGPVLEGIDYDTDPIHCAARDMWIAIKADILAADVREGDP